MSLKTHYSFSHSHSCYRLYDRLLKLRNVVYKSVLCYVIQCVLCYIMQVFLLRYTACSVLQNTSVLVALYSVFCAT